MGEDSTGQVPPGPDGLPVIGNTRELAGNRLEFMAETAREYGDVVRIEFAGNKAFYQDVSFETVPETEIELAPAITLRPAGGLDLKVVPRE